MSPGRAQPGHTALSPVVAQGGEHSLGQDITPHPGQQAALQAAWTLSCGLYSVLSFLKGIYKEKTLHQCHECWH